MGETANTIILQDSKWRDPTVLLQPSSSSSRISISRFPFTNQETSKFLQTNIAVDRDLGKKCWCTAGSVYDGSRCVKNFSSKHETCKTFFTNGFYPVKQNVVLFFLQFGNQSKGVWPVTD